MEVLSLGRTRWDGRAIGFPALSAGVIYLIALPLAVQMTTPAESWPLEGDWTDMAGILPFVGLATAFGAMIAVVPIVFGVHAMAWLGTHNIGMRHPAIWVLAGGAMAAGILAPFGAWEDISSPALALVLTGAGCAALARRYVRWPQDEL